MVFRCETISGSGSIGNRGDPASAGGVGGFSAVAGGERFGCLRAADLAAIFCRRRASGVGRRSDFPAARMRVVLMVDMREDLSNLSP